jgi:hypothetical protein
MLCLQLGGKFRRSQFELTAGERQLSRSDVFLAREWLVTPAQRRKYHMADNSLRFCRGLFGRLLCGIFGLGREGKTRGASNRSPDSPARRHGSGADYMRSSQGKQVPSLLATHPEPRPRVVWPLCEGDNVVNSRRGKPESCSAAGPRAGRTTFHPLLCLLYA